MPNLLLVDDNRDLCELVELILEGHFQVRSCLNLRQAQDCLEASIPDVVLLDVELANHRVGVELLEKIKQSRSLREVPVIAFTAHAMRGDREKFLSIGFDGYISKPILDEEKFVAAIHRHILRGGGKK